MKYKPNYYEKQQVRGTEMYPYDRLLDIIDGAPSPIVAVIQIIVEFGGTWVYFPKASFEKAKRYEKIWGLVKAGLSYNETANRLGVSTKTVQRAVKKMNGWTKFG